MAKECPESPAVVCNDKVLTYSELNQKANQLAHLLIDQGAKPETFIALALPRSAEMVVSMLAVLKAGAAYLPIDPDYPADRIEYMLNDAQPALVMTSKEAQDTIGSQMPKLILDEQTVMEKMSGCSEENPGEQHSGNQPAYMIYTSGSTGRPKGVVVQAESLFNFAVNAGHVRA